MLRRALLDVSLLRWFVAIFLLAPPRIPCGEAELCYDFTAVEKVKLKSLDGGSHVVSFLMCMCL